MAAVQQSADTIIELTQLIERGPEAPDGWMPSQALSSPAQTASRAPVISPLVANMIPGLTEKVGGLMDKFSFLEDRILRISDRLNRVEQSGAFKTGGPDGKEMKNEIARDLRESLASHMAGFDGRMEGLLKRLGAVEQKAASASEELSRLHFDPDDMERRIADLGRARKEAEADFANKFRALSEKLAGFEGALGDRIAAAVDVKTAAFDTSGLAQRVDALAEAKNLADKGFSAKLGELADRLERFEGGLADAMGQYLADHAPAVKPEDLSLKIDALAEAREKAQSDFEGRLASLAGKLDGIEQGVEQSLSALRLDESSLARECQEFDGRLQVLAAAKDEAAAGFARRLEELASQLSAMEAGVESRLAERGAKASAQSADELKKELDSRLQTLADDSASALASFQDELSVITDKVLGVENGIGLRIAQEVAGAEQSLTKAIDERLGSVIEARLDALRSQSQESARQLSDRLAETAERLDALNGDLQERMERFLADRLPALRQTSGQTEVERLSASLADLASASDRAEAGFQASLADLATRVQAFEGGFEAKVAALLDQKDKDIRADLGRLAEQDAKALAEQEERIANLASRVEGFETDLDGKVAGLVQASQADLAGRIEQLASQSHEQERRTAVRLDEFLEKINGIEGDIAQQVEGLVSSRASQLDGRLRQLEEGICGQADELETKLDGIKEGIKPRVEEAMASTTSELSQRIDDLKQNTDEAVASTTSELSQRIDDLKQGTDEAVASATSELSQRIDDLKQRTDAFLEDLSRKVDGVEAAAGQHMEGLLFEKAAQLTERIRKAEESAGEQAGSLAVRLAIVEDGIEPRIAKALKEKTEALAGDAAAKAREEADARIAPLASRIDGLEEGLGARIEHAVEQQSAEAQRSTDALASRLSALDDGLSARVAGLMEEQSRAVERRLQDADEALRQEALSGISAVAERVGALEQNFESRSTAAAQMDAGAADGTVQAATGAIASLAGRLDELEAGLDSRVQAGTAALEVSLSAKLAEMADGHSEVRDQMSTLLSARDNLMSQMADGFSRQDEKLSSAVEGLRKDAEVLAARSAEAATAPLQQSVDELKAAQEEFGGHGLRTAQRLDSIEARLGQTESRAKEYAEAAVREQTSALSARMSTLLSDRELLMSQIADGFSRQDERIASAVEDLRRDIDAKVDAVKSAQEELGGHGLRTAQRLDSIEERIGQSEGRARELAEAAVLSQTGDLRGQIEGLLASRDSLADQIGGEFSRQDERLASAVEELRRDIGARVDAVESAQTALGTSQTQRLDSLEARLGQVETAGEGLASEQTALARRLDDVQEEGSSFARATKDRLDGMAESLAAVEAKATDAAGERFADLVSRLEGIERRFSETEEQAQKLVDQTVRDQTGALSSQIRTLLSSRESLMGQISAGLSRQDVRLSDAVEELRRDIDTKVGALKGAQVALGGALGDVRSALDQMGSPEDAVAPLQQNLAELKAAQEELGASQAQRLDSLEQRLDGAEGRARELAEAAAAPLQQNLAELKAAQEELGASQAQRLDSLEARLGQAEAGGEGIVSSQTALAKRLDDLQAEGDRSAREARERLDGMTQSLASLEARAGSDAESRFTELASRLETALRADIDALKQAQEAGGVQIHAALDEMATKLAEQNGAGHEVGLAAMEEKVALLSASRDELENELSGKLADLGSRLAAFEGRMREQVEERMPAQARSVTEVASRMGALEGRVDATVMSMERKVAQLVSMAERQADLVQEADPALMAGIEKLAQAIAHLTEKEERNQDALLALRRDADQALERTTPKAVEQAAADICARILREEIAALVADMEDAG